MKGSSQEGTAKALRWHNISYVHDGKPEQVAVELPTNAAADYEEEAAHFVQTLEDNHQIQHQPGPLETGKSHQIVTDEQGNKLLKRIRYSAI